MATPLSHNSKNFGVREMRVCKLLTDNPGQAATYAGTTTAVVAAPSPTTTSFSVTPGGGALLTTADPAGIIGRTVTIGATGQIGTILSVTTDAIVLSNTLATAPSTSDVVTLPTSYRLVGAKTVTATPTFTSVDLRGDNVFIDSDTVFQTLEYDVEYAKHNLDVLALLLGGTVTDSGTTPNQKSSWSMVFPPAVGYVRLEARCFAADFPNGDIHIVCNKAKMASAPFPGFMEENYDYPKIKFKVVQLVGIPSNTIQVVYNETALAIA